MSYVDSNACYEDMRGMVRYLNDISESLDKIEKIIREKPSKQKLLVIDKSTRCNGEINTEKLEEMLSRDWTVVGNLFETDDRVAILLGK